LGGDQKSLDKAFSSGQITLGSYQKASKSVQQQLAALQGTTAATVTETKSFGATLFGQLIPAFTVATLAASAIQKGIGALKNAFTGAIRGAIEEEQSQHRLTTALELTGRTRGGVTKNLLALAQAQMKVTTYSHEEIEGVMTLLAQLTKLDEEGIKKATKGTMGLATVLGMDLDSAARTVTKAMEGNYQALQRLGIVIDTTLPKEEQVAQVMTKLAALYPRATAEVNTMGGSLKQLKVAWGEVLEQVGKNILKDSHAIEVAKDLTKILREMQMTAGDAADGISYLGLKTDITKQAMKSWTGEFGPLTMAFNNLQTELPDIPINMQAMTDAYLAGKGPFEAYLALVRGAQAIFDKYAVATTTAAVGITEAQAAILKAVGATFGKDVRKEITDTEATLCAYKKTNDATPAGVKALEDRIEALRASLEKINPVFQTLRDRLEAVDDEMRRVRLFGVDAANSVSDAFGTLGDVVGGTIGDIINSADAIDPDMFKGIGTAVTDIYNTVKKEAIDPLTKAFDGLYNDIATGFANAIEGLFSGLSKAEKKRKADLQAELVELDRAYKAGEISLEEYTAKYKSAHDEMMAITGGFAKFFSNIWGTIKQAFFRVIGEMVAGFIINFVKKIIAGMTIVKAATSAFSTSFGGVGAVAGTAATGASGTATAATAGASFGTIFTGAFLAIWSVGFFEAIKGVFNWSKKKSEEQFKAELAWIETVKAAWVAQGLSSEQITDRLKNIDWWMSEPGKRGGGERWATGFEGIISQPTQALIGEAGPEYVSVQPLNGGMTLPRFNSAPAMAMAGAGGGGTTVTVHLNGPLISTTGVSAHDLAAAGESLVAIINTQLRRVGRKI